MAEMVKASFMEDELFNMESKFGPRLIKTRNMIFQQVLTLYE